MAEVEEQVNELEVIRQEVRKEFEEKLEIWKGKELADLKAQQDKEIQEQVATLFKKWLDEQKPPSLEDVKVLLEQEYAEIPIKLGVGENEDGSTKFQTFMIRELPQAVERKFYRQFKDRIKEKGPLLSAYIQKNMDQPFEKQMEGFLETFDGAFDVLADAVVLILNPFGKKADITTEWVQTTISSNRQYSIILAQIEVNRLRDFFSRLFRSGQKAGAMFTPLDTRQLRQLAR